MSVLDSLTNFDKSKVLVECDRVGEFFWGGEENPVEPAPPRFGLGEFDQCATEAAALHTRQNSQQEHEDLDGQILNTDYSDQFPPIFEHPQPAIENEPPEIYPVKMLLKAELL
jgi:hypothetical protein